MKAVFKKIQFKKEVATKWGPRYSFDVKYEVDGEERIGSFLAKEENQKDFKEGEENEFTETPREYNGRTYYNLAKIKQGSSNFSRQMKREQSKYSGFAMSYAKDLVVAGKISEKDMFAAAQKMMNWMVEQDKALENGK